ncbi:hypothetical protein CerSpe_128140 [Prunus speciosa]
MDDVQKNDDSKHLKVHFESDVVNYRRNSSFPSSSSSSSSSTSSSPRSSLESDVNGSLEITQQGPESQGPPPLPEASSSQTLTWSLQSGSSGQASQLQTMGRPAGYDPSRIPTSIFASKPSTGMDWSVASNESLFSLHVGNNSFSREQFSMLYKSGELTYPDEFFYIPTPLPTVTEAETVEMKIHNVEKETVENKDPNVEKKSVENTSANVDKEKVESTSVKVEMDSVETEEAADESEKTDLSDIPSDHGRNKAPLIVEIRGSATSYRSDDSNHSTKSFQFPLLAGHEAGRHSPAQMTSVKQQPEQHTQQEMHKQEEEPETSDTPETPLKATAPSSSWFSLFYCCTVCR